MLKPGRNLSKLSIRNCWVVVPEDRAPGHEQICTGLTSRADRVVMDPTVHLDSNGRGQAGA
jgi:hypothetical protein